MEGPRTHRHLFQRLCTAPNVNNLKPDPLTHPKVQSQKDSAHEEVPPSPTSGPEFRKELSDRGRQLLRAVVNDTKHDLGAKRDSENGRAQPKAREAVSASTKQKIKASFTSLQEGSGPNLAAQNHYAAREGKHVNVSVAALSMAVSTQVQQRTLSKE